MRTGDFVLKKMLSHPNKYAIIHAPINGDTIALGEINNATVLFNNDTLIVTNSVTKYQPISPIGTSGGFNNKCHVHVYAPGSLDLDVQNIDNAKDPLQYITHDEPNYDIYIDKYYKITTKNSDSFYPGNKEAGVMMKCKMKGEDTGLTYDSAVYNIDEVHLLFKKINNPKSSYKLIQGKKYISKISHGARNYSTRYPSRNNPVNNTYDISDDKNVGTFKNTMKTGIEPDAYSSTITGYPYDYFYFLNSVIFEIYTLQGIV
jgi:hypothetical protein